MTVNIDYQDLAVLRIAARRWARQNPTNPNAQRVIDVVDRNYPKANWQTDGDDKSGEPGREGKG